MNSLQLKAQKTVTKQLLIILERPGMYIGSTQYIFQKIVCLTAGMNIVASISTGISDTLRLCDFGLWAIESNNLRPYSEMDWPRNLKIAAKFCKMSPFEYLQTKYPEFCKTRPT
jgi:hypothetical protein